MKKDTDNITKEIRQNLIFAGINFVAFMIIAIIIVDIQIYTQETDLILIISIVCSALSALNIAKLILMLNK